MKNKTIKIVFLFAALLFLPGYVSAAAPTISNVFGTVATGQTLTITGMNLVQENPANWISRFKTGNAYGFEGTSASADGYCDSGSAGVGCAGTYDTSVKLAGSKSIKFNITGPYSTYPSYAQAYDCFNLYMQTFYFRGYIRYHSSNGVWPDGDLKMLLAAGNSPPGLANAFVQPGTNSSGTIPNSVIIANTQNGGNQAYYYSFPWQENRWYLFEWQYDNQTSHTTTVWIDNKLIGTQSIDSTTQNFFYMGHITAWSAPANSSLDLNIDNMAISTSRIYGSSTIEISNNATYGQGTIKYQEPVYLSDGSIQFKADLTGLGSGPYYLYVTNNGQSTSAAYNLSGGGGGDTTPPARPTGLTIP